MRSLRLRRTVAFVGIAALLFAGVAIWAAPDALVAVLCPLWVIAAAISTTLIRRRAARSDEQPVSLLALLASRAPPAAAVLA